MASLKKIDLFYTLRNYGFLLLCFKMNLFIKCPDNCLAGHSGT